MRFKVTVGLTAALILIALGLFIFWPEKTAKQEQLMVKTLNDNNTGLSLSYLEPLTEQPLTEQDKQDKFISRLSSTEPAMLVSLRYEDGLRVVASVTRQDPLDLLLGNADKAYPARYTDYHKVSEDKFTVGDKKAAEVVFTYKGPGGEVAKQRLFIVMKDDNTAIYISAQAQESQFDEVNTKYFDPLFASVNFK